MSVSLPKKVFVLTLLAILFIHCDSLKQYESGARYWEADIQKLEARDQIETYPDDAILFVGSSSIRLWSTIEEDMVPYSVIQRGYGGAKLSDVAYYTKRLVYPHRFRALVLFVANDICGSDDDKSIDEIAFLFKTIIQTVRKKYPKTPIFFIEITPTNSRWQVWPQIQEANRTIKSICERQPNLYFIDTSRHFLNPESQPKSELFLEDQLHLNHHGYQIWSMLIKSKLGQVFN